MADSTADPFPKLGAVYKSSGHHKAAGKPKRQQHLTPKVSGQGKGNNKPSSRGNVRSGMANDDSWMKQNSDPRNFVANARFPQEAHHAQKPNWSAVVGSFQSKCSINGQSSSNDKNDDIDADGDDDDDDDDSDIVYDSDDELFKEDSESESEKTHEKAKKSKWFKSFFTTLDKMSNEEINKSSKKWHCPACQGGQGAIDWYRGMEPLMNHAMTIKARRVKLHREFAEVLNEELREKGISVIPTGDPYGRWEGLKEAVKDHEIVWPPMVIITNTRYEQEENEKWTGMGNQELLDYFSSYAALKARHSYGPQGHRGMSVLIFESSAAGYLEAVRLHKHFKEQGRDRDTWDRKRTLFCPGGKRQLYGYLAVKEDIDAFNQHSQGKTRLKYEMVSYVENVESQIKQINEDSQENVWLKDRVVKHQKQSEVLADSLYRVTEKLRKTSEENRIVRQRTKLLNKENKEEMDAQDHFFKDQIDLIHQAISLREDKFEKLQQEQREKVKKSYSNPFSQDHRREGIARFISIQDREMEKFEAIREKLIEEHEEDKVALKRRHWEEEVELEKKFENKLAQAMESFARINVSEEQQSAA